MKTTFKPHNFRINSTGWDKTISDGEEYLVNPTDDVWEITGGEYKGEQLFTWDAAMRETQKAGERMPTDEEFSEILKTKEDMPNLVFPGYRTIAGTYNSPGTTTYFWSSTQSGADAWNRNLDASYSTIYRSAYTKAFGFSVRCVEEILQEAERVFGSFEVGEPQRKEYKNMKEEKKKLNVSQSWQCHICGCVWNWFQKGCDYCNSAVAIRSPQIKDAGSTDDLRFPNN